MEKENVGMSIDDVLSAMPEGKGESQKGRYKGKVYDTSKASELKKWNTLKKILRYDGDDNGDVKVRIDNLAQALDSGVLEIRKVPKGK